MPDLSSMHVAELRALAEAAVAELARRAGGAVAAAPQPRQLSLLSEMAPIDPREIDREELLPCGRKRWLAPKEAAAIFRCSDDTIVRRIVDEGAGVQIGKRYFFDALQRFGR